MCLFRQASLEDVNSMVSLIESAYRGESSRQGWTTEADLLGGQRTDREEILGLMADQNSYFLLCENERQIQATVYLQKRDELAYLGMFAVRPELQGKSLGRRVLAEVEKIVFETWQTNCLQMSVISLRTELIDWYRRRGFRATGRYQSFPYGEPRFGLPKRDDLQFEILEKKVLVTGRPGRR